MTTAYPRKSYLLNSVEDVGSSNHNTSVSIEESSFGPGINRSFGAEPETKDSSSGTSTSKESSNNDARSVCVSSKLIEGLEESIINNIRSTDLSKETTEGFYKECDSDWDAGPFYRTFPDVKNHL